jgi:hypothetical protein
VQLREKRTKFWLTVQEGDSLQTTTLTALTRVTIVKQDGESANNYLLTNADDVVIDTIDELLSLPYDSEIVLVKREDVYDVWPDAVAIRV